MIDCIDADYAENKFEIPWPIERGRVYDKTKQGNDMIDHIHLVYAEIKTELLGPIWLNAIYEENQTRQ